jgi:hypothetical protein
LLAHYGPMVDFTLLANGYVTPFECASTGILQALSNHSGTYTRFRLCSHQPFSSAEAKYSDFVSPIRFTCISNSVGRTGTSRCGRPQLGFPRFLFVTGGTVGLAMAPDHTPAHEVWKSPDSCDASKFIQGLAQDPSGHRFGAGLLAENWRYLGVDGSISKLKRPCNVEECACF